jgi:hypothetical protein
MKKKRVLKTVGTVIGSILILLHTSVTSLVRHWGNSKARTERSQTTQTTFNVIGNDRKGHVLYIAGASLRSNRNTKFPRGSRGNDSRAVEISKTEIYSGFCVSPPCPTLYIIANH